ncbi:hypothetical protein D516_1211 [Rhodobacter sp. AKP1]|nr:Transposase, IS4 [Cereibacter sphaeroides KD131]EKX57749.1 hypothetical protein D516_1211 [Rhodobacter sp. AKP1]
MIDLRRVLAEITFRDADETSGPLPSLSIWRRLLARHPSGTIRQVVKQALNPLEVEARH